MLSFCQDVAPLNAYLRWTLVSTTLVENMGAVALSQSGGLTVVSPGGLCPDNGADHFLVVVRYDFDSYTQQPGRTLPAGYSPGQYQVDMTMGSADGAFPTFVAPSGGGGFFANVIPRLWSTAEVSTTVSVMVTAQCSAAVGYTLQVASTPTLITANHVLTGTELVRQGNQG